MSQTLKNLLVLAVFIILIVLGYFMMTQRSAGTLSLAIGEDVSPVLLQKTQIFIERRAALQARTLDMSLFTDPSFTSLRSYATEVPEQPVGRTNIFDAPAPVPEVTPVATE